MSFHIVFSWLHNTNIHDTSRQSTAFDEDFFAIREPCDSDASVSNFVDRKPFENFLHQEKKKAKKLTEV